LRRRKETKDEKIKIYAHRQVTWPLYVGIFASACRELRPTPWKSPTIGSAQPYAVIDGHKIDGNDLRLVDPVLGHLIINHLVGSWFIHPVAWVKFVKLKLSMRSDCGTVFYVVSRFFHCHGLFIWMLTPFPVLHPCILILIGLQDCKIYVLTLICCTLYDVT
jgi:hypothetical protein